MTGNGKKNKPNSKTNKANFALLQAKAAIDAKKHWRLRTKLVDEGIIRAVKNI